MEATFTAKDTVLPGVLFDNDITRAFELPERILDAPVRKDFFTNPVLTEIRANCGKTAAQTTLRFLMQSDVVVISKSTHKDRMARRSLFGFQLPHYDPAAVEMFTGLVR